MSVRVRPCDATTFRVSLLCSRRLVVERICQVLFYWSVVLMIVGTVAAMIGLTDWFGPPSTTALWIACVTVTLAAAMGLVGLARRIDTNGLGRDDSHNHGNGSSIGA